jgi:hypothetical protein
MIQATSDICDNAMPVEECCDDSGLPPENGIGSIAIDAALHKKMNRNDSGY